MRLLYFPVNAAWCFVFGEDLNTATPTSLAGFERFFTTRKEAVNAAKSLGLDVAKNGKVSVAGYDLLGPDENL